MAKFSFKEELEKAKENKFDDGIDGKKILLYGVNDTGKALVNSTLIPTPNGFKRVDEIKVGDMIFGKNGKPTKVIGVHPQHEKKEVYEVNLMDGRSVLCCADHLWEVRCDKWKANNGYKALTTKQLIDYGVRDRYTNNCNFKIDLCAPVDYEEKNLPIDPWVLGAVLGNGCLTQSALEYSSGTAEIPSRIAEIMGWEYRKNSDFNYTYTFKDKDGHTVKTSDFLAELPELIGKKSHDKSIPEIYMTSSIDQRLAIVNGLLDTDGSVATCGSMSYSSTSYKMCCQVMELLYSLGCYAKIFTEKREPRTENSHKCHTVTFTPKLSQKRWFFTVEDKQQRIDDFFKKSKKLNKRNGISIVDIHSLGYKDDMTCFTVDADDHLYLANDYVVTHNTYQASHFPKPFLIMTESGGSAVNIPKKYCGTWSFFKSMVDDFTKNAEEYAKDLKTIIIDTAENLVDLSEKAVCNEFSVRDLSEITGRQNGYKIARSDFSAQINKLTSAGYCVVFVAHEEKIEETDEVTGETYTFVQPKGTSSEKGSMRMLRDLCDFCIYLKPMGINPETFETIPSMAICKRTKNVFARSRFAIETIINPFTAENIIKAIEDAVRKSADNEGAQLGAVEVDKKMSKDDYLELIKPYVEKLFVVCKDDVNIIVSEELGDGRKISSATDDELIKLDNIYNRLVTKATLLGIEV